MLELAQKYFSKFIQWLSEHISNRNYQILVAIIIGVVAAFSAVILKYAVFRVREWMYGNDPTQGNFGFVVFPIIGILLSVIYVRFVLQKKLSAGFPWIIYAISKKKVNLPAYETYAHIISSSLTVGLGGSVGLEAPIVRTGSAVGSNLAGLLKVGRNKQTLFLACGATAGMAAIFNSPVAAVVFAFEVLLAQMALHSFIPLLISAATGAVVARFFYYEQLFYYPTEGWQPSSIPFFFLMGITCGLFSAYMMRMILYFQGLFSNKEKRVERFIFGGLSLGLLIFLLPPLFGEGYETVNQLLQGDYFALADHSPFNFSTDNIWIILLMALVIILTKPIATAATLGMGGNGGIFAPAMFSGALLGFVFAMALNLTGYVTLHTADFIAVGMAGMLSGIFKSPLTGIFLIAEITGGYVLFVPLMIVSALAFFVAHYFEPQSIFTKRLYQKGLWVPAHEKDLRILKNMEPKTLIERNFATLHPDQKLRDFTQIIARTNRNVFPVVDDKRKFLGIVLLDDVREIMFKPELYDQKSVRDFMHNPPTVLKVSDSMESIMQKFEEHQAWNLPIVKDEIYQGFISKSTVLGKYRELLQLEKEDF